VSGGHLSGIYELVGFHFHWGDSDSVGSEHTIDGKAYPVEVINATFHFHSMSIFNDSISIHVITITVSGQLR